MTKLYEPIIVVGTGRSGTSMVAGILCHLGVYMGDKFVKPDKNNPRGHWEDRDFCNANCALKSGDIDELQWQILIEKALIARKSLMRMWGFKDPRIAELLHLYLSYFTNAKFVWCKRNEKNTINSMRKAYEWTDGQARQLIDHRTKCLKRWLKNQSVLVVNYEDLRKSPSEQVQRIFNFINADNMQNAINSIVFDDPVAEHEDGSVGIIHEIPRNLLN